MFDAVFDTVFDQQELTGHTNEFPIMYGRIRESGLFRHRSVATTMVQIDRSKNGLTLLPAGERGADGSPVKKRSDSAKFLEIPHIPHKATVTPDDVQDRRMAGTEDLESIEKVIVDDLEAMARNHDITYEFMAVSAMKGVLVDGDGNVLYDYFSEFDVPKPTLNFQLNVPATDVLGKCNELVDLTRKAMVGDTFSGTVRVPVDGKFFQQLTTHANVEKYYLGYQQAMALAGQRTSGIFPLGDVIFEKYLGDAPKSDGTLQPFIDEGKGHAYPEGTQNTFWQIDGPAYALSQTNQAPSEEAEEEGSGLYVTTKLLDHDGGVEMKAQANRLLLCQQPRVLTELSAE